MPVTQSTSWSLDYQSELRRHPDWSEERLVRAATARYAWLECNGSRRERMKAWFSYRKTQGEKIGWGEKFTAKLVGWWPKEQEAYVDEF